MRTVISVLMLIVQPVFGSESAVDILCERQDGSRIQIDFQRRQPHFGTIKVYSPIRTPFGTLPDGEHRVIGGVNNDHYTVSLPSNDVLKYFSFPDYILKDYTFQIEILKGGEQRSSGKLLLSGERLGGPYFYLYHESMSCLER